MSIQSILLLVSLVMFIVPCPSPVQAGVVSRAAAKVALRRAEQRAVLQAAERDGAAISQHAIVRNANVQAEKSALAEARTGLARAARQKRKGQISAAERYQKVNRYDHLRDNTLAVKPLAKEKKVYRYHQSMADARRELREGVALRRHLTSSGPNRVGRPIGAETAQHRYGLSNKPVARTTVTLPAGSPVKQGKVIGGQAGYGEITPTRRVAPENVSDLRRLP